MFTPGERDSVRAWLVAMARDDPRVISGAEVGSLTQTSGDRWSDLDLTFGVSEDVAPSTVLADWTAHVAEHWGAVDLFDVRAVSTTYRVFLFPGNLQVDLSVTSGAASQMGPKFRVLFGDRIRQDTAEPLRPRDVFGLCVHHALRARISVERGRIWASLYYLDELRNESLSLACLLRGLPAKYARGLDALPAQVLTQAEASLARSTDRPELLRAISAAIELLLAESNGVEGLPSMEDSLRDLTRDPL